eukprot:642773_1
MSNLNTKYSRQSNGHPVRLTQYSTHANPKHDIHRRLSESFNPYITCKAHSLSNISFTTISNRRDSGRKRKYIEIFDDECCMVSPNVKQHITQHQLIDTIQNDCLPPPKKKMRSNTKAAVVSTKPNRKRTFDEMNDGMIECKDRVKRMKLSTSKCVETQTCTTRNNEFELIPSVIKYADFAGHGNRFVKQLCRKDRLNKYNGALIKYKAPTEYWQDLMIAPVQYDQNKNGIIERDDENGTNDMMDCD